MGSGCGFTDCKSEIFPPCVYVEICSDLAILKTMS